MSIRIRVRMVSLSQETRCVCLSCLSHSDARSRKRLLLVVHFVDSIERALAVCLGKFTKHHRSLTPESSECLGSLIFSLVLRATTVSVEAGTGDVQGRTVNEADVDVIVPILADWTTRCAENITDDDWFRLVS
ncbi:hypothetical protein C8Q73DRAFT_444015 [Cubamyces lactineus]|nr:hypothetical protein C8Q73DRAFT_444015 [Cubamyces lactineus]